MKKCQVNLNHERAIVSSINSVDNLGDAVREPVMNSVDAIENPSDGKIEIRVGDGSICVLDNGKGCFDHQKFTAFRDPSDESNLISFEGIGMKTMFQFFRQIDVLSHDAQNNQILRINNFHVYDEAGKFDPSYEYEIVKPENLVHSEFLAKLNGFTTLVSASQPLPDTNLGSLLAKGKSTHILHVAEEPIRFLSKGGKITVVGPDSSILTASLHSFKEVKEEDRSSFSSDKDTVLFGNSIPAIHADAPEKAVRITIAVSKDSLGGEAFQEIYLEDSRIRSRMSEYVRPYLKSGIRKGSASRLQIRVELSQYYKTHYRLNHNKHNLKDDPILQEYLTKVLQACDQKARAYSKGTKKDLKPKEAVANIQKAIKKLWEKYEGKKTGAAKKCKELLTCIKELGDKVGLEKAA